MGSLLLAGSGQSARAQATETDCTEALETAEEAYLNRQYEEAIGTAQACVEQEGVDEALTIRAYRIMSLAYLRQNALQQAHAALVNILAIDPTYAADPVEDPPSYALFVSLVRQDVDPEQRGSEASADPTTPVNGVRVAPRNRGFERFNGLNVTVWRPVTASGWNGRVSGVSVGLPFAGAPRLQGIALGGFVEARRSLYGVGVGGVGLWMRRGAGLTVGGLGAVVDERFTGLSINGLGAGGSGALRGILVGGLGIGATGSVTGLSVGAVGIGSGARIRGIQVGGIGVGARGNIDGLTVGAVGALSGANITGGTLTGAFIRANERLRGIQLSGGSVMAPTLQGITVSAVVLSRTMTGFTVAPVYARSGPDGAFTGVSISAFNHVRERQQGLAIGLFNYAQTLRGVQLGALNYAGNNPLLLRLLPGINLNL